VSPGAGVEADPTPGRAQALVAAAGDVDAFGPEPVPVPLLERLCQLAIAPHAGRLGARPCEVLIVVGDERERLVAQVAGALVRHVGTDAADPRGPVPLASEAILSAPAFILVFASHAGELGFDLGAIAGAAAQNLVLLCRDAGLGTHRITAARVVPESVLDFAADHLGPEIRQGDLMAMLAVGWAPPAARLPPEQGSRIVTAAHAPQAGAGIPPVPPPAQVLRARRRERVVVVDLYPFNRALLRAQLERAGYQVEVYVDGHQLSERVAHAGDPDLFVVSDVLPDTTGFDLVRRLREQSSSRAPVIITTTRRDPAFRIAGLAAGVDYYLRKPLVAVELYTAARLLLDRRSLQAKVVQQGKMAALGQLVAGVAHEINTPLAALVSNNDLFARAFERLRAQLTPPPPELDVLQSLVAVNRDAGARITEIVRTLRSFARLDEADRKAVDLHEGLESTLLLCAHLMKGGISVVRDYGALRPISCHPNQLNQVFMNLIVNACQAMGETGQLTLRTRAVDDRVELQIEDTGCGMSLEQQGRIFDPGYTTKGAQLGTGLGLAIVYQIVEHHGGEITVESQAGRGTTFTLRLPVL
jgi:signal transduction histidine kinase